MHLTNKEDDNAARIVECVNACEPGGAVAELVQICDELLAKSGSDWHGHADRSAGREPAVDRLRAAVERIVGGE